MNYTDINAKTVDGWVKTVGNGATHFARGV